MGESRRWGYHIPNQLRALPTARRTVEQGQVEGRAPVLVAGVHVALLLLLLLLVLVLLAGRMCDPLSDSG